MTSGRPAYSGRVASAVQSAVGTGIRIAVALALSVGTAEARDVRAVLKAKSPVVLRIPFNVPGCYPTGSAMGTRGETITFSRAGTKACGGPTCQENELCVTADGAQVATGESLSVALPLGLGNQWCYVAKMKPPAAWIGAGNKAAGSLGGTGGANTAQFLLSPDGGWYSYVTDGAASANWVFVVASFIDGSSHSAAFCSNGTQAVYHDGVAQSVWASGGTGTGMFSAPPATVFIGSSGGVEAFFGGAFKDVKVCISSNPARC